MSRDDVQKILAQSEIEMKKRRRIKLEREQSIGKVSSALKKSLKRRLSTRLDRETLASRLIIKENSRDQSLFGARKKGGLANFLKMRPTKSKLMSLNIISEEKEGVCPAEKLDMETKRKARRKENLAKLLGSRPSAESLKKKKIIIDPDAIDKDVAKTKLESFLKLRPKSKDKKVAYVRDRSSARRRSMKEASEVLGGFLKKRVGVQELAEKKILNPKDMLLNHHQPHTRLGEQLSFQAIALGIKVAFVSCGWAHTVMVDTSGMLYTCGLGQNGRLGHGNSDDVPTPTPVPSLKSSKIAKVECGDNHTVACTKEGKVYTWGMGAWGRLGQGSQEDLATPAEIKGVEGVDVAAGGYHTLIATKAGKVLGFGWNRKGQVGAPAPDHTVSKPIQTSVVSDVKAVYCGIASSGALTKDGKLYVWGGGVLGKEDILEPVLVSSISTAISLVAFGATHFLAYSNGSLYSWGSNTFGELGREFKSTEDSMAPSVAKDEVKGITALGAGRNYSAAIVDGSIMMCGKGAKGVLGSGKTQNLDVFTLIEGTKAAVSIGCGHTHTVAVCEGGGIVACGSKDHGRLGDAKF